MTGENPDLPIGWYAGPDGARRYWDGSGWLQPIDPAAPASDPATAPGPVGEPSGDGSPSAITDPLQRRLRRNRTVMIAALAVGVLLIAGVATAAVQLSSGGVLRDAEAVCRTELIDSLKSPATAVVSEVEVLDRRAYIDKLLTDLYDGLGLDEDTDHEGRAELLSTAEKQTKKDQADGLTTLFVVGLVDSENGFSATVRNEWTCEITYKGSEITSGPSVSFPGE